MSTNLCWPGGDFDLERPRVSPALIRRFDDAARTGADTVTLWGTGTPRREFLRVDAAGALIHLLENHDGPEPVNVGTGEDLTVAELARFVVDVVGFTGTIQWDTTRPDGAPRKVLDVTPPPPRESGWAPTIDLHEGITTTLA